MNIFGIICKTVKRQHAYPDRLTLAEAFRALPYRLSVAWIKFSLGDRNYGKFKFWAQEKQRAEEILRKGEAARAKYCNRELDPAMQKSVLKEVTGYLHELEELIIGLDQKSLDQLANRALLRDEVSKLESVIGDLSKEFEGYRFWMSGKSALNAVRRVMGQEAKLEVLIVRAEKIRTLREELVATAQNLKAVNAKLLELQRSFLLQPVNDLVRNQLYAAFASIKTHTMKDNCRGAIFLVLNGSFEKELRTITTGQSNQQEDPIVNAFAVFGLQPGATYSQVKKIYREGIWENHEDKNKSPQAQERARELNIAFGVIRKYFNILNKHNPIGDAAN